VAAKPEHLSESAAGLSLSDWPWPPIDPAPVQLCIGGFKTVKEALDCGTSYGDRIQIKAGNYKENDSASRSRSRSRPTVARS
jgi:hypothetical protein